MLMLERPDLLAIFVKENDAAQILAARMIRRFPPNLPGVKSLPTIKKTPKSPIITEINFRIVNLSPTIQTAKSMVTRGLSPTSKEATEASVCSNPK